MNDRQMRRGTTFRIDLMEVLAVIVGYGLAAVLFRAYWPSTGVSPSLGLFAIGFYLWLGLAMSGPLLLFRRGNTQPQTSPAPAHAPSGNGARSWAEMAWLLIGVYWIVLGVFVLPVRLHSFRFSDTFLFGMVPFVAGLVLRLFGPRPQPGGSRENTLPWTHHAAVVLLATWPLAWFCLIVIGFATF